MKNYQHHLETLIIVAIYATIVAGLFVGAALAARHKCSRDWEDSNMQSRYRLGSGCQVRLPNNTWVPASSIRN